MGWSNSGLGSNQKWNIGTTIRAILLTDSNVAKQVGNHIYPLVAAENTDGDFIIYTRVKYTKSSVKNGVYNDVCEVAVTAVADNYDNSMLLACAIDNALTGQHILSDGTKLRISFLDGSETFEDNKYIQTLLFNIE